MVDPIEARQQHIGIAHAYLLHVTPSRSSSNCATQASIAVIGLPSCTSIGGIITVAGTRRLERHGQAFPGDRTLHAQAPCLHPGAHCFLNVVKRRVRPIRVVVEENQLFDVCCRP